MPEASSEDALRRMRHQRRADTAPELALRRELHRRGLRYRLNYPALPRTRRRVDIAFPSLRVAVEVYGCFWHACPEHGSAPKSNTAWWVGKLAANAGRDADTAARLEAAGWALAVVWEHEPSRRAADRVQALLDTRRSSSGLPRED